MSNTSSIDIELIENTAEKRKKILEEAKTKSQEILKLAKLECSKINADSDKQIMQLMGSELKTVRDRIIGRTELEGRKNLMMARTDILSDVYNQVEERLREIVEGKSKEHDYHDILKNLIIESVNAIEGTEFILSVNKKDLVYLTKNIKKIEKNLGEITLTLDNKPVDIIGGVIVRNSTGDKIYYNTLDGKLESIKKTMDAKVATMLGVI
jgi:vacuolar-type H+-ATPase subunit E/Vma4